MSGLLKSTLMLLGAACVLLLAGGFPLMGAPGVYQGGAALLVSAAVGVVSLWGAWRLSRGARVRLACGVVCLLLAAAGVAIALSFGKMAVSMATETSGGWLWFGVLAVSCTALIGVLLSVIFGLLGGVKIMTRRLWLAGLHLCVPLLLLGAYIDFVWGESEQLSLPVGQEKVVPPVGSHVGFRLKVEQFDVLRYDSAESYMLMRHEQGRWVPIGSPSRQGDEIVLGEERWPVSSLRRDMSAQPFLMIPGFPPRVLVQQEAPVKEFRARCRLTVPRHGGDEVSEALLRVNEPIFCEGRWLYLMNYVPGREGVVVQVQLRRAPGRECALLGMLGIIVCSVGWCFCPPSEDRKEAQA